MKRSFSCSTYLKMSGFWWVLSKCSTRKSCFRVLHTALHTSGSGQIFSKCSFPTPQAGHVQPSGMSSKAVPGAMPDSGSPSAGS